MGSRKLPVMHHPSGFLAIGLAASLTASAPAFALATPESGLPRISGLEFASDQAPEVRLRSAIVTVHDKANRAIFRGTAEFLFGASATGRAFAWDLARNRIRVSEEEEAELWLSCKDVAPMPIACAATIKLSADGRSLKQGRPAAPSRRSGKANSNALEAGQLARLPLCPGDPRCPKL
jgi:hypothetical protein